MIHYAHAREKEQHKNPLFPPVPLTILLTGLTCCDMAMPGTDGEAPGAAIEGDPALRDTLPVMMASLGRRGDAARLNGIGVSAHLTKPVKHSLLYDGLVTVLGSGERASTGPSVPRVSSKWPAAEDTGITARRKPTGAVSRRAVPTPPRWLVPPGGPPSR